MTPLAGILVADFSTLLPGPMATLILAEAGAEVVKVERPGGEEGRKFTPIHRGNSAPFVLLNRGKKSLVADLKTPEGKAAAWELIAKADVLVEQFRPGVMERLGFGYEAVKAKNPSIIYCSISGYGQKGPREKEAGHDINYIGNTGLLSLAPGPVDRPVVPPALIADLGGGTFPAVTNILLALIARGKSGKGAYLDIAMTDAMFLFTWYALATMQATGKCPGPGEMRHNGGSPRYQLYPTRDGKLVAAGPLEDHFWAAFTKTIGLSAEFIDDRKNPNATRDAIRAIISGKDASHWKPLFAAADCCVTIVANMEEALNDPHFVQRGLFARKVALPDGGEMTAIPVPVVEEFRTEEKKLPFPTIK
jgi:alpha-methylacyl-CoA racemase